MLKRLFFGLEVKAPWPTTFPSGRLIEEEMRHLTLAFLGNADDEKFLPLLPSLPSPNLNVGIVGQFDQPLFLPPHHPHVASWHITWLENADLLTKFYEKLHQWLQIKKHRDFLPHVTLARSPFDLKGWKKSFFPLPMMTGSLHLFESLGHSKYASLWKLPIAFPFQEIEHTADVGYLVRGENLQMLFNHAAVALAFSFPPLLSFLKQREDFSSLEEVVMALNEIVSAADQEIGCPFKAVSFHGKLQKKELLEWEMIIDV